MIKLACPLCKSEIVHNYNNVACTKCKSVFPIISGIINFFPNIDEFYEGKFGIENTENINPLKKYLKKIYFKYLKKIYFKSSVCVYGIRNKHEKYYRKLRPAEGDQIKVLDLGCGGGNSELKINKYFYVCGIDLSLSSLLNARKIYDEVYKASTDKLPFPSNTFDCICSFDLIGHMPLNQKNAVFNEINRVLKPGGLSFHYIEVDSPRGYNNWAKRYPELYKKYFIDQDGHFGLEYYKNTLNRFKKHDFSLIEYKVLAKFIIPTGTLSKWFNNEYKSKHLGIRIITLFDFMVSYVYLINMIWGLLLKPFEIIFEPLIPDDYGGLLFVSYRKK